MRELQTSDEERILTRFGLACFYYATNGIDQEVSLRVFRGQTLQWRFANNWVSAADECTWYGISCNQQGQVQVLDMGNQDQVSSRFQGNRLSGYIPPEGLYYIRNSLRSLILMNNPTIAQSPAIDPYLGGLVNLELLLVSETGFRGSNGIPTVIGQLTRLRSLSASATNYTGTLRDAAFPTSLQFLDISSNDFSGSTIPRRVTQMPNLQLLWMHYCNLAESNLNFLTGMSGRNTLQFLWLDGNDIRGTLPGDFLSTRFPALQSLSLTETLMSGPLPEALNPQSLSLSQFLIYENAFTGGIPNSYGQIRSLAEFQFEFNLFDVPIPSNSALCDLGVTRFALSGDCCICPSPTCCSPCALDTSSDFSGSVCPYEAPVNGNSVYVPRLCIETNGAAPACAVLRETSRRR